MRHNVIFNGGIAISTSQKKFGNSSFYFDGASYITIPDSDDWNFGSGDFTVDGWFNFSSTAPASQPFLIGQYTSGGSSWYIWFHPDSNTLRFVYTTNGGDDTDIVQSWSPTTGVWYHLAFVRSGNSFYHFVNGTQLGSTQAISATIYDSSTSLRIGYTSWTSPYFNGYIDEVRISKGIARWTSNFTPPTERAKSDLYTVLLLHGEGDYSNSPKTLTTNGTPVIDGATVPNSLFQGSMKFNGTSDFISILNSSDWDFSGDFTIECWVNFATTTGTSYYIAGNNYQQVGTGGWGLARHSAGFIWFVTDDVSISCSADGWSANTWHYITVVRLGSSIKVYGDGVEIGSGTSGAAITSSNNLQIGRAPVGSNYNFNGYIAGLKISKGRARYIANFTPLDSPNHYQIDGNDGYTKLLISSNNTDGSTTFIDSSYNNHTITPTGNTQHKTSLFRFDPSSIYFDGSGYLEIPDNDNWNLGSGDFTIDFCIYFNSTTGIQPIIMQGAKSGNTGWGLIWQNSIGLRFINPNTVNTVDQSWTPTLSTWYHVAVTRSGNSWKFFINGAQQGTTQTFTESFLASPDTVKIGWNPSFTGSPMGWSTFDYLLSGYMSEIRITKGIARLATAFTPPTKKYNKLKIDTNTKLLIHGNGADASTNIVDSGTTGHVITANGAAQIKTNLYRFYPSSIYLDSNGYLSIPNSSDFDFGSGDFTIDTWINFNSISGSNNYGIIASYLASNGYQLFYAGGPSQLYLYVNGIGAGLSWTPAINTWYHVALVRSSSVITAYINGTSIGTYTDTTFNSEGNGIAIGSTTTSGGGDGRNQYFQEFRISKGIARWTSNFAPPEKPYGLWF